MKFEILNVNPSPPELGYTLPLQTVKIQISWHLKKPTDLDMQFAIMRLYQQPGSSNVIGWQLEIGVAS